LETAVWSSEWLLPADISSVPQKRYIQLEVKLQSDAYTSTPVVDKIQLYWGP